MNNSAILVTIHKKVKGFLILVSIYLLSYRGVNYPYG